MQGELMATRGKAPFQKRQKEMARKDKQQRKAERRANRKLDNADSDNNLTVDTESFSPLDESPVESDEPESIP
jgi:hypothetical protein